MDISRQQSYTIRGIAILLLLLHHYSGMEYSLQPFWIFRWVGTIVCAVFFFFSGYGMSLSFAKIGERKYRAKRLLTLYIPFVLANVLFLLYSAFARGEIFGFLDSILYISGINLINGHTWFLQVLIVLYICCFIIKKRNKYLVFSMLAGGGYIALTGKIYALSFLTFILGLYWDEIGRFNSAWLKKLIPLIAIASFAVYAYNDGRMNTIPLLFNFVTMNTLMSVVALNLTVQSSALAWIGKNSMAFYITHGLPLRIVADISADKTALSLLLYLCLAGVIGIIFLHASRSLTELCKSRLIDKPLTLDRQ